MKLTYCLKIDKNFRYVSQKQYDSQFRLFVVFISLYEKFLTQKFVFINDCLLYVIGKPIMNFESTTSNPEQYSITKLSPDVHLQISLKT